MNKIEKDPEREDRIEMEAIVDAYGPEEQAMGWYYYLQDRIAFPFQGRCLIDGCYASVRNRFARTALNALRQVKNGCKAVIQSRQNRVLCTTCVTSLIDRCYAPDAHTCCQSGFARLQSRVNQAAAHSSRNITYRDENFTIEERRNGSGNCIGSGRRLHVYHVGYCGVAWQRIGN